MAYTAGFLGCGNMGGTLARCACKAIEGKNVAVCDLDDQKTSAIKEEYGAAVLTSPELVRQCRYVFLGLKPQVLSKALDGIADAFAENQDVVLVSMAAGVAIDAVAAVLSAHGISLPIIRIMPNTPAEVGEGMILYCKNELVTPSQLEGFLSLMAKAGRLLPLDEGHIDAGCSVSGCGPAYAYLFIEALADGGVECGLSRADAQLLAAQTVLGAAKMVLAKGNPGALKDAVCSPGGTTIAGVHALEKNAFRNAAMDAVTAAYQKTLGITKS